LTDIRYQKFAQILVHHSTKIKPGDRVVVTSSTAAEPFLRELFVEILRQGGYPHLLLDIQDQDELFYQNASNEQLDFVPIFHKIGFEQFDVLMKIRAETNTRALSNVDKTKQSRRQKAISTLLNAQLQRGASKQLRWISTIFPTPAYAMEAEMGFEEFQTFAFRAMHADKNTPDPLSYWQNIERQQQHFIDYIEKHDRLTVKGPHVDLSLSIKGRKFINAAGEHNLPDGEIYTGPVEDSVEGWVRFTLPAIVHGQEVDGIELTFSAGQVIKASAQKNEAFLKMMLATDPGASYVGEFAIGTNMEIDRLTRMILYDEKTGGSFHMALGAGYPETGSINQSMIHWDMICDLRHDSEIRADGELIYKDGRFVI
jgi:aminopeptidase